MMESHELQRLYLDLTTPHVVDAIMRLGLPVRQAPASVTALWEDTHLVGRVLPARHTGSVDVFLEAIEHSEPGDVLVVDNGGRDDEACVGDLVTLEAAQAGLAGIIIWGLHRDSRELRAIRLPVYSQGALPAGPRRLDPQPADAITVARVGQHTATQEDVVFGDDDGVLFLPLEHAADIAATAAAIRDTERRQAALMRTGRSLREQARFSDFLTAREVDGITFREHLRAIGGEIEE
ncbi:RraA family protein [Leucobacter rhizosphaerae]|uniref:Putative 4-hydroxy-4-methyl-2-oxoglutarate aldolase n=1 Tax=Leucobacter rhizosphaerae TaxID=2932245 RepID=A0ABY4FTT7_9MICO|nr:RraA family protein [Leucobacter rhizosphaerae]UOQ59711.1 RraA family protein [Leucobacter rhizosphaerae]